MNISFATHNNITALSGNVKMTTATEEDLEIMMNCGRGHA